MTKTKKAKPTKRIKPEFWMNARVYDSKGNSLLVKVPVIMTSIPELPEIIFMNDPYTWAAKLISTNPPSYLSVLSGKAKKA